jgi:co-chaperonin GroES (HSP10)
MKKENVTPCNFNVLVEVTEFPTEEGGVFIGKQQSSQLEQTYYRGTALELGPRSTDKDQCPELEKGDFVIFSDLAGYPVATDESYCKVIRGHDIVALTSDIENMNAETLKPTGERILVEVLKEDLMKDGVYDASKGDPRAKATQLGKVLKCAENTQQFPEGTIVAFEPYAGNPIHVGDTFYKTINSFDIEFIVSEE